MATTMPISRLDELQAHLDVLIANTFVPLNAELLDDVELQLTPTNIPPLLPTLLPKLITLLHTYPYDPAALVSLSLRLIASLSFVDALALASPESLTLALQSPAPSAAILALTILHKAADSPATSAMIALMPELLSELLVAYLNSPAVSVGEKAGRVLGDLLEADCEIVSEAPIQTNGDTAHSLALTERRRQPGQGRLWRRIFTDKDTYTLLFSLLRGTHPSMAFDQIMRQQMSLAQGRILRLIPRLAALNLAILVQRSIPDQPALLPFAALEMVDTRDVLLRLTLLDFWEALVSVMRASAAGGASSAAWKIETLRGLLRDAIAQDPEVGEALRTLPDKMVPEEQVDMRAWVRELLPERVEVHR